MHRSGLCDWFALTSQAFEKVFLDVGSVTDNVSSRNDVDRLPMVEGIVDVSSDSFGRFISADRGVARVLCEALLTVMADE